MDNVQCGVPPRAGLKEGGFLSLPPASPRAKIVDEIGRIPQTGASNLPNLKIPVMRRLWTVASILAYVRA
jgi:hypothetical protein